MFYQFYVIVGQNFSSDKIFITIRNFRHFRPTQKFLSIENFVLFLKSRQWALNRSFTVTFKKNFLTKFSSDQIFRRTKFWSPPKKFITYCLTKFSPIRYVFHAANYVLIKYSSDVITVFSFLCGQW